MRCSLTSMQRNLAFERRTIDLLRYHVMSHRIDVGCDRRRVNTKRCGVDT
ncbi:MAG: hypothetical protein ABI442_06855 [Gemmatimonadaceae bacterium]